MHPINTPYQYTLLIHSINAPYQCTYQHILSLLPINIPSPINPRIIPTKVVSTEDMIDTISELGTNRDGGGSRVGSRVGGNRSGNDGGNGGGNFSDGDWSGKSPHSRWPPCACSNISPCSNISLIYPLSLLYDAPSATIHHLLASSGSRIITQDIPISLVIRPFYLLSLSLSRISTIPISSLPPSALSSPRTHTHSPLSCSRLIHHRVFHLLH